MIRTNENDQKLVYTDEVRFKYVKQCGIDNNLWNEFFAKIRNKLNLEPPEKE